MRPDVVAACAPWRLAWPDRAAAGRAGDRLGRGTGASLEFVDFRDYTPGDDLRHVDWRAYARTDALQVRLFREEVAPHVDLIVDVSASMASTPAKAAALRDLASGLAHLAERSGARTKVLEAGGGALDDLEGLAPAGPGRGALLPRLPLRPRSVRVVLSDFLVPDDPVPLLRGLAAGGAHVVAIQLLDPWEADPVAEGPATLVDVEDGARLDLDLDAATLDRYRVRLGRLTEDVSRATRAVAGRFASVRAGDLPKMLREGLSPAGVVEPA